MSSDGETLIAVGIGHGSRFVEEQRRKHGFHSGFLMPVTTTSPLYWLIVVVNKQAVHLHVTSTVMMTTIVL